MLYAITVRYFGISVWPHAFAAATGCIVTALLIRALALRLFDRTAGALAMLPVRRSRSRRPYWTGLLYVEPFVNMFSTLSFFLPRCPAERRSRAGGGQFPGGS